MAHSRFISCRSERRRLPTKAYAVLRRQASGAITVGSLCAFDQIAKSSRLVSP